MQVVNETAGGARERVIERDCSQCGQRFTVAALGRPPRYCSQSCRQRAWGLRQARAELDRGDPHPEVVREVIERTVEVPIPTPVTPRSAREWSSLLDQLSAMLSDPSSELARRHYDHGRIYRALLVAWSALDQATPGGCAALDQRR